MIGDYMKDSKTLDTDLWQRGRHCIMAFRHFLNASVLVNGRVMQDAQQKDLGRILQMLKMSRKGYQVQVERRNKEDLAEKTKLRRSIEQLNREIHELGRAENGDACKGGFSSKTGGSSWEKD